VTFATTGGHVWKAAHRLADYLEASADAIGLSRRGVNVLELGSGTGWMGMVLAHNLKAGAYTRPFSLAERKHILWDIYWVAPISQWQKWLRMSYKVDECKPLPE